MRFQQYFSIDWAVQREYHFFFVSADGWAESGTDMTGRTK